MATGRANERDSIPMPAPTAWPMLFAAGICLAFAGLVTNAVVSLAGAALFAVAGAGWLREVLPQQRLEEIALRPAAERAQPVRRSTVVVEHLEVGRDGHRMRLPVEVHPWSAGLRGGLLGAGVMALLAVGFGLLGHSSPWYPINLLAATAMPTLASAGTATLEAFDPTAFAVASAIHLAASLVVGLLYALILPMIPRHPAAVGGLLAPLLWSGLLWAVLGVLNPALNRRIEWPWFVASQIGFGLAAGWLVARTEKISTLQGLTFAARAGVEAAGFGEGKHDA